MNNSENVMGRDITIMVTVAAVAIGVIGSLMYNVLPLYMGSLQDSVGLDSSQTGLVASAFFLGSNLVGLSAYFWVRRASMFYVSIIATLFLLSFLFFATRFDSYILQIFSMVCIGSASGALGAISATIISDTSNTARWFGIKLATECLAGVVLLITLPVTLIPSFGFSGTVLGMVMMTLIMSTLIFFLSRSRLPVTRQDFSTDGSKNKVSSLSVWFALLAVVFYFIGNSGIWTFMERFSANNNFDPSATGIMLGVALFFAVIGALITGVVGSRFGNIRPFFLCSLILLIGASLLFSTTSFTLFSIGAYAYMLAWSAAVGYLLAMVSDTDPDGRHIALAIPAGGIGSMIGPALAGYLYSDGSTLRLVIMLLISISIALLMALKGSALNSNLVFQSSILKG